MYVLVDAYGSIICDEEVYLKPLYESEVVSYRKYENEFYNKRCLLKGLHWQLAYFGLSQNLSFIHEVLSSESGRNFASQSIDSLATAYSLYSKSNEDLEKFKEVVISRFSLHELQDEVARVARNPEIKFSINERFEQPLRYLISENKDIETFKTILNIIFDNNFEEVEGFSEFKTNELSKGKSSFYNEFWNIENYRKKYINGLGI